MSGLAPRALPHWWSDLPFSDPVAVLIRPDAVTVTGSAAARAAAARLGGDWARMAAEAGNADNFLYTASDGAAWRMHCETSGETARTRAEPVATSVLHAEPVAASVQRAEQFLHLELARRLAGGLRHGLRNALNALSLHAELLERGLARGEAAAALERSLPALQARLAELGRLQDRLVDDWHGLAEVARPLDPAALLEDVRQLCHASLASLPVQFEVPPCAALPALRACPRRLKWILLAGILAAAQRAGPGGALRLTAALETGRLAFEMGLGGARGQGPAGLPPAALLAAAGALAWGLAQGRDEFQPRADGGWRLAIALDAHMVDR